MRAIMGMAQTKHLRSEPSTSGALAAKRITASELLDCSANLACIPRTQIKRYQQGLSERMGCPIYYTYNSIHYEIYQAVGRANFDQCLRTLQRRARNTLAPLKRIVRLADEFTKALDGLDEVSWAILKGSFHDDPHNEQRERREPDWFERDQVLQYLIQDRIKGVRWLVDPAKKSRDPHRPAGSIQNPVLRSLVLDLYQIVEAAGGKLTLRQDDDGETRGTLASVLEVLRPFLPDVIPVRLPYKQLRDLRKLARERHWSNKSPPTE
jgi:hypothetical protein